MGPRAQRRVIKVRLIFRRQNVVVCERYAEGSRHGRIVDRRVIFDSRYSQRRSDLRRTIERIVVDGFRDDAIAIFESCKQAS